MMTKNKSGLPLNVMSTGSGSNVYSNLVEVFGCKSCKWVGTSFCRHRGEVTKKKPHANRICNERKLFVKEVAEDGGYDTFVPHQKVKQLKTLLDVECIKDEFIKKALESGDDDALHKTLPWFRMELEARAAFIKQEEGSKLQIERKVITPADLADMIDAEKVVEAEVRDVKKDG